MRAGSGRGEAGAVVAVVGVEGEDEESLGNINRTSESRPTTGARKASSKWVRGLRRVSALEIATLRPKIAATAQMAGGARGDAPISRHQSAGSSEGNSLSRRIRRLAAPGEPCCRVGLR